MAAAFAGTWVHGHRRGMHTFRRMGAESTRFQVPILRPMASSFVRRRCLQIRWTHALHPPPLESCTPLKTLHPPTSSSLAALELCIPLLKACTLIPEKTGPRRKVLSLLPNWELPERSFVPDGPRQPKGSAVILPYIRFNLPIKGFPTRAAAK